MAAAKKSTNPAPAVKKSATSAKKSAPSRAPAASKPAKASTTPATPSRSPAKAPAAKAPAQATAAKKAAPRAAADRAAVSEQAPSTTAAGGHDGSGPQIPAPRGTTKDGIAYTRDFDAKFLKSQKDALLDERAKLVGQAVRLEDEANSLIEDGEMGDVQFDDESGEGDTMVVERERDLALSAQARQTVADIDDALARIANGTYGYSTLSGQPIPRERLEAIPWATELVEEKVGGIGRR
jgi:RNA polymerase-binding transcription factor DksA